MNVPFFRWQFDPEALAGVEECLRSGWLTTGPKTKAFEAEFARALASGKSKLEAVALNSCTAALHLALEAIGARPGDSVIVPTMTFAATAEVVRYFNATPVLVDCEPDTLNISVEALRRTVEELQAGRRVAGLDPPHGPIRAILPVHYGGQPCDLDGVTAIAASVGAAVIEDAAHAFPAGWVSSDGGYKFIGDNTSLVTCFSFYANKTISTGEGGMAVTADPEIAARMRLMSLHGMNKEAWRRFTREGNWDYELVAPGFKYNLTDIASAIGLSQLKQAEVFRLARERVCLAYEAAFEGVDEIELLAVRDGVLHSRHLFPILLRLDRLTIDRARVIEEFKQRGVACSVHWRPLHLHPYYRETYGYVAEEFPVAASLWPRLVSLPLFPSMTEEEIEHVTGTVIDVCAAFSRPT